MAKKKKKLTREDAAELYRDLHKTMSNMNAHEEKTGKKGPLDDKVAKQLAQAIRSSMKRDEANGIRDDLGTSGATASKGVRGGGDLSSTLPSEEMPSSAAAAGRSRYAALLGGDPRVGSQVALMTVLFFLFAKVSFSVLEYSGVFALPEAHARMGSTTSVTPLPFQGAQYTEEELVVLQQLDARRVELEERQEKIRSREEELSLQEQELLAQMTELRDLTERLKTTREKNSAKKRGQLEQLANVYGSMNPKEAAQLIEQLDVTIALSLLERMPEKRIGQILSLMSPERALTVTKMLTTRERVR
ncbi:hypothetical protein MRY87_00995 [bacterium]|nr:hypothetical protein [bacterium]